MPKPLITLIAVCSALMSVATTAGPLDGLRLDHPRVIATDADIPRIRALIEHNDLARRWYDALLNEADTLLDKPAAVHELHDGKRMLSVSREVFNLVHTLALLHWIEPDPRYVDRVWTEIEAVCGFSDWNPSHFLDTAEMACAVGVAYDWLYDEWSDAQRATMRSAIVSKGLEPGVHAHERGTWWTKVTNNWNQVCNGGLAIAALAIADQEPELCTRVVELAVATVPLAMARYAPDGGYEEGPGYWSYGTRFNVMMLAAMDTALGHMFGLDEAEGFDQTGRFVSQLTGATGQPFNFGDTNAGPKRGHAAHFWLANRYNDAIAARFAARTGPASPLALLWYRPESVATEEQMPLSCHYEGIGVVTMRTAWDDRDAVFLGIKGGTTGVSHGQLDLGSFVYEANGVRWFHDLGNDDYNLPGYFSRDDENSMRWRYYRNRAEGHNTLVINPAMAADQRLDITAETRLQDSQVTLDLSDAYGVPVERTFDLNRQSGGVRVADAITLGADRSVVWWFAHTRADIEIRDSGTTAILHDSDQRLRVSLRGPREARFEVMDAIPLPTSPDPDGQNPNNGARKLNPSARSSFVQQGEIPRWGDPVPSRAIRKLAIKIEDAGEVRIVVEFEPLP